MKNVALPEGPAFGRLADVVDLDFVGVVVPEAVHEAEDRVVLVVLRPHVADFGGARGTYIFFI